MLIYCGLITPYGQHWLRMWTVALQHQAITWTNVDLSSIDFFVTKILQEVLDISMHEMMLKIAL